MKNFFPVIFVLCFAACKLSPDQQKAENVSLNTDSLKTVLLITDVSFSDLSSQKGVHKAFMSYAHDQGALLRPHHHPIVGRDSIRSYLHAAPDTGYTLTWAPAYSDISACGDLGYTYGTYKLTIKQTNESEEGTYCSIWKQDGAGNWKFVLDTGNPGLDPARKLAN